MVAFELSENCCQVEEEFTCSLKRQRTYTERNFRKTAKCNILTELFVHKCLLGEEVSLSSVSQADARKHPLEMMTRRFLLPLSTKIFSTYPN